MRVKREKLYSEVWAEPSLTVAKRYNVSSSYLGRVCERLDIPRPPRGFWAQRAAGIEFEQPALPDAEPGAEIEWVRDGSEPQRQPMSATASRARRRQTLQDKHPLLVGARAHFDHARESRDEQYVRPYKRNLVDVFVSKDALERALKMASDLFRALEDRGQRVMLAPSGARYGHVNVEVREGHKGGEHDYNYYSSGRWSPAQPTVTLVGDVAIGLTIFEVSEEVEVRYDSNLHKYVRVGPAKPKADKRTARGLPLSPHEWTTKHWVPSGRLGLHAYAASPGITWARYWREAKPGELPGSFEAIAKELEQAAPAIVKLIEQREREAVEWRRKCEVERLERERKDAERHRIEREARREKELHEQVGNWRFARDIRAYVAEVHALVTDAEMTITDGSDTDDELKWALKYADGIDPLSSWRRDIAQVRAERATGEPCAKCGERHRPRAEGNGETSRHRHYRSPACARSGEARYRP